MERTAVRLAALGALAYLLLVVLPYVIADPTEVATYYGRAGLLGPLALLAPTGVAVIAALSGAAERSDPATMAGVAVVMAATTTLLTALWALPAGELAAGMASVSATFDYHRWALLAAANVLLLGCAGYAAVLGLGDAETKGV